VTGKYIQKIIAIPKRSSGTGSRGKEVKIS